MFTDPNKNLKQFGLRENMVIADLGAGTGFYSILLAQMVPQGKVYAIDIQKDFLTTVKNKAKEEHLDNIEFLWGNIEKRGGTNIGDGVLDAVVVSDVFFQIENKERFIDEVKRILKPTGKVLLIDWLDGLPPVGSGAVKIFTKEKAREIFEAKSFIFERDINVGEYHYGMILNNNLKEKK